MNKVNIYIWKRELITRDKLTPTFKYGAELTWPKRREGDWYDGHWLYTPLFDTKEEAEQNAKKLAKIIEKATRVE